MIKHKPLTAQALLMVDSQDNQILAILMANVILE